MLIRRHRDPQERRYNLRAGTFYFAYLPARPAAPSNRVPRPRASGDQRGTIIAWGPTAASAARNVRRRYAEAKGRAQW